MNGGFLVPTMPSTPNESSGLERLLDVGSRAFRSLLPPRRPRESLGQQVRAHLGRLPEPQVVGASARSLRGARRRREYGAWTAALFVKVADYVRSGIQSGVSVDAVYVQGLLAEGYLISVGTWLARLEEPDLNALGQRVIDSRESQG